MEEIEVPTEHLHEAIQEKAKEAIEKLEEKNWSLYVAISTALMAVFAAISGLLAGHHSNEALIEQIKASDQWAFYQAKGIKAEMKSAQSSTAEVERYKKEQEEIKKQATEFQQNSNFHLAKHIQLAKAVTLFQVAIAISAIAILTRRKFLWWLSMLIAVAGIYFFLVGL